MRIGMGCRYWAFALATSKKQSSLPESQKLTRVLPPERDDKEAIDKSNIIKGDRTRHAKPAGTYKEPGDEEGLPGPDDGTSAVSTGVL